MQARRRLPNITNAPSASYSRAGWYALIPFAVITVIAVILLPRIQVSRDIFGGLRADDAETVREHALSSKFSNVDYFVLLVQSPALYSTETLRTVEAIQQSVQALPGVAAVLAVTNTKDVSTANGELDFAPLYDSGGPITGTNASSPAGLRRNVDDTPLFRKLLISKNGSAFLLYVFPKGKLEPPDLIRTVQSIAQAHSDPMRGLRIVVFGSSVLSDESARAASHEFVVLTAVVLLLVYLLEVLFTRSALIGLVLWLGSLVPALWTVALFPLCGVRVEIATIIVPVMVIALSTRYGIYLFRYFMSEPARTMEQTLGDVTPVIASAGVTTMLGFLTLTATPISLLRTLGLLVVPGIAFAVIASLFLLPRLLDWSARDARMNRPTPRRRRVPQHRPWLVIAFGAVIVALLLGIPQVRYDYRSGSYFKRGTTLSQLVTTYERFNGGFEEIAAIIDSGSDYGLVDPAIFRGIARSAELITELPQHPSVVSYSDFVTWLDSRLAGRSGGGATTSEAIGESLELLASQNTGVTVGALIDPSYRWARVEVRFGDSGAAVRTADDTFEALQSSIAQILNANLPAPATYALAGTAVQSSRYLTYLVRGQLYSSSLFLLMLLAFASVVLRSVKWSLLVLCPPLAGMAFYFGVMGWAGIPFSPFTLFLVAAMMGVSNDDILFFLIFLRRTEKKLGFSAALQTAVAVTARPILQTSTIIVVSMASLGLSQFSNIAREGLLGGASFLFCMVTTYFVIPIALAGRANRS